MTDDAMKAVEEAARAARGTVTDLASVPDERLDAALRAIADALGRRAAPVLAANEADMTAGREAGLGTGLWSSCDELAQTWRLDRRFEPSDGVRDNGTHARWLRAVDRSRGWEQPLS